MKEKKKTARNVNKGSKPFFMLDPSYGPKKYDTLSKTLPNNQSSPQNVESNRIKCTLCNKMYKTVSGLKRHQKM